MTSTNPEPAHLDAGVLERLEELLAKATATPWVHYNEVFRPQFGQRRVNEIQTYRRHDGRRYEIVRWSGFDGLPAATEKKAKHNAALIVAAINALPSLLRALREAARPEPQPLPAGWVLVPKVPTVEMIVAATEQWLCVAAMEDRAEIIWDEMIEAAPAPPRQDSIKEAR